MPVEDLKADPQRPRKEDTPVPREQEHDGRQADFEKKRVTEDYGHSNSVALPVEEDSEDWDELTPAKRQLKENERHFKEL